jgi:hypothetical protein
MHFLASLQLLIGIIILYFKALKNYFPVRIHVEEKSAPLVDSF